MGGTNKDVEYKVAKLTEEVFEKYSEDKEGKDEHITK